MADAFRETRSCIFRPTGFMVKRRRGDFFEFADLNPEVSFATKLTPRDRLRLAWWFFRAALARPEEDRKERGNDGVWR